MGECVRSAFSGGSNNIPRRHGKVIHASALVKFTAEQIANEMVAGRILENEPDFNPYWGFLGNTICDGAFDAIPCGELLIEYPIEGTDWIVVGHPDRAALDPTDLTVAVGEGKFHNDPTKLKQELAKRQGALYLALMWRLAEAYFEANPDAASLKFPTEYPLKYADFHWFKGAKPEGVVVGIAPPVPDFQTKSGIVNEIPLDTGDLHQILDHYLSKAMAIISAIESMDFSLVKQWDAQHSVEFVRPIEYVQAGAKPLSELAAEHALVNEQKKGCEARLEELKVELMNTLQANNVAEANVGDYRVKVVERKNGDRADVKALREQGLYQYIIPGTVSVYPDVRRVRASA